MAVSGGGNGSAELAVIYIHGKGDNFYGVPFRRLAPHLDHESILHISLNMQCHDLGYTRTDLPSVDSIPGQSQLTGGGMWEDLDEGEHDIALAVEMAVERGARKIFLIGHSSGAFYAADYAARRGGVDGLVLLSPLTANRTTVKKWFASENERLAAIAEAKRLVDAGRGRHLLPIPYWYYAISAESFLQRMSEADGVFADNVTRANVPTIFIWGSLEARRGHFRDLADRLPLDSVEGVELDGLEHNYVGHGQILAHHVNRFLDAQLR
jgi:pimeloyl-ACP methyl ester carboxylesterase